MTGCGRPRRFVDVSSRPSRLLGVPRILEVVGSAADRNSSQSGLPEMTPLLDPLRPTQLEAMFPGCQCRKWPIGKADAAIFTSTGPETSLIPRITQHGVKLNQKAAGRCNAVAVAH